VQASLDPHHGSSFDLRYAQPIVSARIGASRRLLGHAHSPDLQMLCHGLWNNTPQVVAYNRELLS
jgi:hypothetical protein